MAATQCWKLLLVLAALAHWARGSTCADEEGKCTILVVLGETTNFDSLKGSGNAADGACPLADAAPELEMAHLTSTNIVIIPYEENRTTCCKALKLLTKCSHIKSAELDQQVSIAAPTIGDVSETPSSNCEDAKLVLGECTVLGGLASGVTAKAIAGNSGTGADGACELGVNAPEKAVESLTSWLVALRFGTDLDKCCKAKEALDACKSFDYAEYDSEVTIAGSNDSGNIETGDGSGNTEGVDDSGNTQGDDTGNTQDGDNTGSTQGDDDSGSTQDGDDSGNNQRGDDSGNLRGSDDKGNNQGGNTGGGDNTDSARGGDDGGNNTRGDAGSGNTRENETSAAAQQRALGLLGVVVATLAMSVV